MDKLKFEHEELKKIFGKDTKYIKLDNIELLNENTRITVVKKAEGDIEEYDSITLKDYLYMLDKYYNPDKENYKNEISIRTLKFSTMTQNALNRAKISYISQLENLTEIQLRRVETIGDKAVTDIKSKLKEIGKKLKDE